MNSFVLHLMHEELMYIRCDIVIFWQRHGFWRNPIFLFPLTLEAVLFYCRNAFDYTSFSAHLSYRKENKNGILLERFDNRIDASLA